MGVIAFLSDFGETDHYVAAVKAAIIARSPDQPVIDISHHIKRHDIVHAAYVLKNVYKDFPEKTVFLAAVDPLTKAARRLVALELDNRYFVGHDSGIYSLISDQTPTQIVELPSGSVTFPARDTLANAATELAQGKALTALGKPLQDLNRKLDRQVKATKQGIVGQVIHIDYFGNLITNIHKEDFDNISQVHGGSPTYVVRFAREAINKLHSGYHDVDQAECFVFFNNYGQLEIGIHNGRACDLLGLKTDSQVSITFNP